MDGNLLSLSLLRKGATYTFVITNQLPVSKGLLLIEYLLEAKQYPRCFVYSWNPAVIELSRCGVTKNWFPIMKWKSRLSARLPSASPKFCTLGFPDYCSLSKINFSQRTTTIPKGACSRGTSELWYQRQSLHTNLGSGVKAWSKAETATLFGRANLF